MTVQEFKLAALDLEITDSEVKRLFLNTEVNSEEEINEVIAIVQRYRPQLLEILSPKIGNIKKGVYRHFKGRDYLVLGEVSHSETGETLVLYAPLYGKFCLLVRPKAMFTEEVNNPEFNYQGPRFRYIGEP